MGCNTSSQIQYIRTNSNDYNESQLRPKLDYQSKDNTTALMHDNIGSMISHKTREKSFKQEQYTQGKREFYEIGLSHQHKSRATPEPSINYSRIKDKSPEARPKSNYRIKVKSKTTGFYHHQQHVELQQEQQLSSSESLTLVKSSLQKIQQDKSITHKLQDPSHTRKRLQSAFSRTQKNSPRLQQNVPVKAQHLNNFNQVRYLPKIGQNLRNNDLKQGMSTKLFQVQMVLPKKHFDIKKENEFILKNFSKNAELERNDVLFKKSQNMIKANRDSFLEKSLEFSSNISLGMNFQDSKNNSQASNGNLTKPPLIADKSQSQKTKAQVTGLKLNPSGDELAFSKNPSPKSCPKRSISKSNTINVNSSASMIDGSFKMKTNRCSGDLPRINVIETMEKLNEEKNREESSLDLRPPSIKVIETEPDDRLSMSSYQQHPSYQRIFSNNHDHLNTLHPLRVSDNKQFGNTSQRRSRHCSEASSVRSSRAFVNQSVIYQSVNSSQQFNELKLKELKEKHSSERRNSNSRKRVSKSQQQILYSFKNNGHLNHHQNHSKQGSNTNMNYLNPVLISSQNSSQMQMIRVNTAQVNRDKQRSDIRQNKIRMMYPSQNFDNNSGSIVISRPAEELNTSQHAIAFNGQNDDRRKAASQVQYLNVSYNSGNFSSLRQSSNASLTQQIYQNNNLNTRQHQEPSILITTTNNGNSPTRNRRNKQPKGQQKLSHNDVTSAVQVTQQTAQNNLRSPQQFLEDCLFDSMLLEHSNKSNYTQFGSRKGSDMRHENFASNISNFNSQYEMHEEHLQSNVLDQYNDSQSSQSSIKERYIPEGMQHHLPNNPRQQSYIRQVQKSSASVIITQQDRASGIISAGKNSSINRIVQFKQSNHSMSKSSSAYLQPFLNRIHQRDPEDYGNDDYWENQPSRLKSTKERNSVDFLQLKFSAAD